MNIRRIDEELHHLRTANSSLEDRLLEERSKRDLAEGQVRQLNEELRCVREDLSQQRLQSTSRMQQRETELTKLRQQIITSKHNDNGSAAQVELEKRWKSY